MEEELGDIKGDLKDIICKKANWLSVVRILVCAVMEHLVLLYKT